MSFNVSVYFSRYVNNGISKAFYILKGSVVDKAYNILSQQKKSKAKLPAPLQNIFSTPFQNTSFVDHGKRTIVNTALVELSTGPVNHVTGRLNLPKKNHQSLPPFEGDQPVHPPVRQIPSEPTHG